MTNKPSVPPNSDEPSQTSSAAADFLNRPEFKPAVPVKQRHRITLLLVPLLVLVLLAGAGYGGYRYYLARHTQAGTSTAQPKATDPYAGWKTYTSSREKASFKYPSNWTITKPYMVSNDVNNTDQVGIKSPSGAITISYVTTLVGFGDEHSGNYPLNAILSKSPITGAPGLFVVSGVTTLDSKTYYPWIAVQDSSGITTSGVMGNAVTFTSHWAIDSDTNDFTRILFSTSAARTNQNTPALTKSQAEVWFSGTEAKQAKLIMLSLQDAPNPYSGWHYYLDHTGSGFSFRYPVDWTLDNSRHNAVAWVASGQGASISGRWIALPTSNWNSPKDEWDNCPSLDACGHQPSDKTLDASTETVNGLDVYVVKMQGSSGIYHTAIIKSSMQVAEGSTPSWVFVELTLSNDDPASIAIWNQMVATAQFSN